MFCVPAKNRTLVLRLKAASSTIELQGQKRLVSSLSARNNKPFYFPCCIHVALDGIEPPQFGCKPNTLPLR